MQFRKFLEAAATISDIPDDVVIARVLIAGGHGIYFYFADANTLKEIEENFNYPVKPHGSIEIGKEDDIFRVYNVVAADGWGPLLHDLAMEYATKHGKGLGPDPRENSQESVAVWNYYLNNRSDVKKTPSKHLTQHLLSTPSLKYVYSKSETITPQLLKYDLLVYK